MKLVYGIKDKPSFGANIVFAIQQLLAIMTATLVVPVIVGHGMQPAAALFGAGVGTIIYGLFTKFSSPVFLGSSFAFLGSMAAAFAGAATVQVGYLGLIIGAILAGLVYVVIALIVKCVGVNWINKLMPAVVIGPTVAIIGLSLAGNAVGDLAKGTGSVAAANPYFTTIVGIVTLIVVALCATFGKKTVKMIPFIIGILAGYVLSVIFTVIGNAAGIEAMKIINFDAFKALVADGVKFSTFFAFPEFTFLTALGGFEAIDGAYITSVAVAYIPVAFVVFAEHVADHKNISSIIEKDL
ncbi:MAG: uracil-xanthine permease, partial [Clostridia bacterium]|nr:uracil-xanthine permease [Clostridia bacterium]